MGRWGLCLACENEGGGEECLRAKELGNAENRGAESLPVGFGRAYMQLY